MYVCMLCREDFCVLAGHEAILVCDGAGVSEKGALRRSVEEVGEARRVQAGQKADVWKWIGAGEGDDWAHHRQTIVPAFSMTNLNVTLSLSQ